MSKGDAGERRKAHTDRTFKDLLAMSFSFGQADVEDVSGILLRIRIHRLQTEGH